MRKLTLLLLIAATYCMVAGGPYGLEDLVHDAGYCGAILILLLTPVVWSLPTALMVSELSSALPEDGGYYAWVRRALGPFWGFQEAWLSLVASIFDMAIYPTLFTLYLGRLCPALGSGAGAFAVGIALIAVCAAWNIGGARTVGSISTIVTFAMLVPFIVLAGWALFKPSAASPAAGGLDVLGGVMVAMWNYMGWDNASTIAGEVDRPQRTYPLAMLGAVALVALTYILPITAVSRAGIPSAAWSAGSWSEVAGTVVGHPLAVAVVFGGMLSAVGMFNALMMSYARVPLALAEDGYLPRVFARRHSRTGAPWAAILACAVGWAACLTLGFKRLVALDVLLYGLSLILEFAALVSLRIRQPDLPRPFRVPGGLVGAILAGIGPSVLIGIAVFRERGDHIGPINALAFGLLLAGAGAVSYLFLRPKKNPIR